MKESTDAASDANPSRFRKDFIPELDGLRAFAVLLVLWVHLPAGALGETLYEARRYMQPGYLGVDLFFVLSGFLITRILLVDRERGVPLRFFLARRFLRIFPIYYLTIFAIQLIAPQPTAEFFACLFYYANYAFAFIPDYSRLEHFWSLAVEEHYYMLWPPLATFLSLRASRRVLFGFFAISLGTGLFLALRPETFPDAAPYQLVMRGSTTRFGSLALGSLIAYHELAVRSKPQRITVLALVAFAVAFALSKEGLFPELASWVSTWSPVVAEDSYQLRIWTRLIAVPLVSAGVILLAIAHTRTAPLGIFRLGILAAIGRISYGLYVYHYPVYYVAGLRYNESPTRIALAVGATFVIATVSYLVIERPLINYAKRFRAAA